MHRTTPPRLRLPAGLSRTALALAFVLGPVANAQAQTPGAAAASVEKWGNAVLHHDAGWYKSGEARTIADSVLLFQSPEGGWPKNTNLSIAPRSPADIDEGTKNTFDNGGTSLPLQYLARMVQATGDARYRQAFERGLDYTLVAQYPNGGWPQFYPLRPDGYYSHITFNDDAITNVLTLLRDIASGKEAFTFVDPGRRARADQAVARGTDVILRTQLKVDGKLAGWCAQYDEKTLQPAWARKYEPPSLSGGETVGIVRFLMQIDKPSPAVIAAVEGAVQWLQAAAIKGIRVERFTNAAGEPDRRIVEDAAAPPIWARFYELGTSRPIFLGRDSVARSSLAEIERERRAGYSYYGNWAETLLRSDYPRWKAKHG